MRQERTLFHKYKRVRGMRTEKQKVENKQTFHSAQRFSYRVSTLSQSYKGLSGLSTYDESCLLVEVYPLGQRSFSNHKRGHDSLSRVQSPANEVSQQSQQGHRPHY